MADAGAAGAPGALPVGATLSAPPWEGCVPPEAGEDAAWVSVATPLPPAALLALLDDPERLLRVNPTWEFDAWQWRGGDGFMLRIRTLANGLIWETAGRMERMANGVALHYEDGIKAATRLRVEPDGAGSRLWIIEDYERLPRAQREARSHEVDPSLPQWGAALYRYLAAWARWSRFAPWRWYMERVWRPARPLARRIVRLLLWATVAELAVFALLIAILVAESS